MGTWVGAIAVRARQLGTITALSEEQDNLRTAMRHLLDKHEWERATQVAAALTTYWWISGLLGDVRAWTDEVIAAGDAASAHARGQALWLRSFLGLMLGSGDEMIR